jgi:tetratricopeptide (TPR) repeat protein
MYALFGRRPEVVLLASLLVFAAVVSFRALQDRPHTSVAVDTAAPAPAPVEVSSEEWIARLQDRVRSNPDDVSAYAQLGLALLQRVRETADPMLYPKAEAALAEALKRDPQNVDALVGQGTLALARHHFADALGWGVRARQINPYRAQIYGVIGDAQVELGQYDAALDTVQKMVDTRPELSSYSRVSYLRELQGDTAGAIALMQQAVASGVPTSESTLWAQAQLGHLYFNSGDLQQAEQTYAEALRARPDYVYAQAGIARVRAAQGRYDEAIDIYQGIVKRLPLPEFVIALGDLYEATGKAAAAKQQYDLVHAMQQLNASAGIDVDMELALFDADHGVDPAGTLARARAAYQRRPSIYAADALAWALYRAGDYAEARRHSQMALRLGTRDALMLYHAGAIAQSLGDRPTAREYFEKALALNPYFSVRYAPLARQALEALGQP